MNLSAAPDRARGLGAGADTAAARLYNDIEAELALGGYTEDAADAGEEALSILEGRFPGVRTAARGVTEPPALSRRAKRELDRDPTPDRPAERSHEHEREPRGGSRASGGGRAGAARSAGARRPSARRVIERAAGVSGESVSGQIITGLQWLLAAGLAYQVLQPRGSAAFSRALGAIGGGVRVLVDPVDPLAAFKGSAPAAGAPPAPHTPPGQMFDTPSGPAPFRPPTFGNPPGGVFDTPGGVSPFKPPTGVPTMRQFSAPRSLLPVHPTLVVPGG